MRKQVKQLKELNVLFTRKAIRRNRWNDRQTSKQRAKQRRRYIKQLNQQY